MKDLSVSFEEAVAVLKRMIREPGLILGVHVIDETSFGPFPYFFDQAEVTVQFNGGALEDLVSIRVGVRFSNDRAWDASPMDALTEAEIEALEAVLLAARSRARSA